MSLREWLIAIGTLVILGIVIDGIRRMRRARKDAMTISSGMGADELDESPLDDEYNPELPNGGARPATGESLRERGYLKTHGRTRFSNPDPKPTRPVVASRTGGDGDTITPEEAGPVTGVTASPDTRQDSGREPTAMVSDSDSWGALDDEQPFDLAEGVNAGSEEPASEAAPPGPSRAPVAPGREPPVVTSEVEEDTARRTPSAVVDDSGQPLAGANRPDAEEVLVINVLARPEQAFDGKALKKLFEACGLEFGDMDIYHRHEQPETTSPVQFSVANAVEPGTFHARDMATMATPGISFFMSLPGPSSAMQAFEFMLETAQCVVRNLGGELKDERRSVMTPQTIEHCRQRIREYERKHHSPRG